MLQKSIQQSRTSRIKSNSTTIQLKNKRQLSKKKQLKSGNKGMLPEIASKDFTKRRKKKEKLKKPQRKKRRSTQGKERKQK